MATGPGYLSIANKALNYHNVSRVYSAKKKMPMRKLLLYIIPLCLLSTNVFAYLNVTYLNTTVILSKNTSAEVVETLLVNMSNSSIGQYLQDRQSINLTLSDWSTVLHTNLLIQHIFNPNSSIAGFTFLPGPIINNYGQGAQALLTMRYVAYNITTVQNIGPRKFVYTFDSAALNFEHTQSGEALPQNARFNIIIPKDTSVVSVYPEPDFPYPNFIGNYNNDTVFSWYEGEPLSEFSFSYLSTQSLQNEVTTYFSNLYENFTQQIYLLIIILASIFAVYVYVKVFA
jgi:hypothetical protein